MRRPPVDVGILLQQLQTLGELPLGRDPAAVAGQPRLAALGGERVDPIGVGLRRVVLPELDVGVRAVGQLGHLAQWRAVVEDGQHRARGEVGADPDHVVGVHSAVAHRRRHRVLQHVDVVVRHLERPVRRQSRAARLADIEVLLEDAVAILVHRARQLRAVADPHDDGTP